MPESGIPLEVRHFVWRHLPTIDHVAVLLSLRSANGGLTVDMLAERASLAVKETSRILRELEESGLASKVAASGGEPRWGFAAEGALAAAAASLQECYDTRPVTLVRTIYDRPASVAHLFADAFRLRRPENE